MEDALIDQQVTELHDQMNVGTVCVVIVTWNSAKSIGSLLMTLPRAMRGAPPCDVVVVDNASTDETVDIVRRLDPSIRIVQAVTNDGYAAAINRGQEVADPQASLLVLNADLELGEGMISALLAQASLPGVGIVVPRLLDADGRTAPSLRREPTGVRAWAEAILGGRRAARMGAGEVVVDPSEYEHAHDVDWASGAALLVTPACRRLVGSWDESFFLYSEETDYMLRARDAGLRVRYAPEAVALHSGGDLEESPRLWALQVSNRIELARRRSPAGTWGRIRSAAFRAGVVANEAVRAAPTRSVHRAGLRAAIGFPPRPHRGIVWFGAVDWWYHNRAHSDVQLARHLADSRPVLFVNSIGIRVPLPGRSSQPLRRVARKAASIARGPRTPVDATPDFHVFTPLSIPSRSEGIRRLSARMVRAQVAAVARLYGIEPMDIVATIPSAIEVAEGLPHTSLTFNRSDLHSAFPEADGGAIEEMERHLLQSADNVLYVSRELMALDRPVAGRRARFLDHGVDIDHFTPDGAAPEPPDIAAIPHPRVGFFGGIDDYVVDLDLIDLLALQLPEASIVLIGDATCSMERFESLDNVHVLGPRPYESIPAYGRAFDVAIMPWLDNPWIRFCNPVKLKEYLALGLPVVSTSFPEVGGYRDVVYIAHDREEFVSLVRYAITRPGGPSERGARRARVEADSWDSKASELAAMIDASA